jgi:hypothetical protein
MNESNLEKRLRDVAAGTQPSAPLSLHRFLRELPEVQTARRRGPLGRLRAAYDRVRWQIELPQVPRRVQVGFGIAMALVIAFACAGALLTARLSQGIPGGPPSPSHYASPTPIRILGSAQPAATASINLAMIASKGVARVDQDEALPMAAVMTRASKFLGISGGAYGANGLVRSDDGLNWTWSPPADVNPQAGLLTSIAADSVGTIVISGGVTRPDGTIDGRVWVTADSGATWREATDESVFQGMPVQIVVHGTYQFLAFGWNDTTLADAYRPVSEWRSIDGMNWTALQTPIKGTDVLAVSTASGFVLSGVPVDTSASDEPPIWHSTDGVAWTRAKASDNSAPSMGPLVSATVTLQSHVYAVSASTDGASHHLVSSFDGGTTWQSVTPNLTMADPGTITHIASLSTNDVRYGQIEYLFATTHGGGAPQLMVSANAGLSWQSATDPSVGGPAGTDLVELGGSYRTGATEFISFGAPGSTLGIWTVYLTGMG